MSIELKNISKTYIDKPVLTDISLNILSREFFVLVGPSGGGKTTILKMLNRLIEPSSGKIFIDDEPITSINLRELRFQIGYVLQQIALFPNMTVAENISLIPALKNLEKGKALRHRAAELLPLVGLDPDKYLDRMPGELSGGEAQRIGILRAIAGDPKIILMDEPFSALDPISRKQLQNLVKQLQHDLKITTVFVTHDMNEAMALADHIAIVREGSLAQVGRPDEILSNPADDYVASFFKNYQRDLSEFKVSDLTKLELDADLPLDEAVRKLDSAPINIAHKVADVTSKGASL